MNWSTPKEIIGRRTKERDLFFSGKWSNNGSILEYQVGKNYQPVSPKSVNIQKELEAAFKNAGVTDKPITPKPEEPTKQHTGNGLIDLITAIVKVIFGRK